MTFIAFASVGAVKGKTVGKPIWESSLETISVGGIAALISYIVGLALHKLNA